MRRSPELQHNAWPAASTIGDILKRNCLIEAKRRRRKPIAQGEIVSGSDEPNGEWAIDFKGWFRTLCGTRCDPLTITDTASRYLIETRIIDPTWAGVRSTLERVFSDVGLPQAIRSDNGAPFGSTGAGGLSSLSVWCPGSSPGSASRRAIFRRPLRRTTAVTSACIARLKAETARPPAATVNEQQARFDRFRRHYNEERPHEALQQTPPARH